MLKALVETVFTSADGNYAIELHTAIRLISALGSATFGRRDVQNLIARMCADGWMEQTGSRGFIVVGMRALIELQSFFNNGYDDYMRFCSLCKEMATCGRVCSHCDDPAHPFCADQVVQSAESLSCPKCHRPMPDALSFGPNEGRHTAQPCGFNTSAQR
ncbi:hypothetical protein GGI23_000012 [Coemansia sp. RSA 2559]|nr:hypothetical protein GGI23_000012 [Coemansia sp. RSA 2559]KAJ2869768.1 hypothetical protein GGI22_000010 [Coemansia erecta]